MSVSSVLWRKRDLEAAREPRCAMIAAVKGWSAVLAALLFFLPRYARSADDPAGAARELVRRTAAFAGRGALVAVAWRNVASLDPAAAGQARAAFETTLEEAGVRVSEIAPAVEVEITLSEFESHYLMVEETRKGEERQVWIASWKRGTPPAAPAQAMALEKKLVWEQDEAILDVAFPAAGLLVLSPARIALYMQTNGKWEASKSIALTPAKPWPRDLRGHLRTNGKSFQAFLPGMACSGTTEPALQMECHVADEPWVLESGSRALLLGKFAAARPPPAPPDPPRRAPCARGSRRSFRRPAWRIRGGRCGCWHRWMDGARSSTLADRKSTRLNSSHLGISDAVFCLKKE